MSIHIGAKKGQIAETVLLPGDPLRAKYLAETYLENPECYNQVRGMLGFTGTYNGKKVSVQGTGMGIPSISIYVHELIVEYGAKRLIRIGTCGALQEDIKLGDVILAQAASTDSSVNRIRFNGGDFAPAASFELLLKAYDAARERGVTVRVGTVLTEDTFYSDDQDFWKIWVNRNSRSLLRYVQPASALCGSVGGIHYQLAAEPVEHTRLRSQTFRDGLEKGVLIFGVGAGPTENRTRWGQCSSGVVLDRLQSGPTPLSSHRPSGTSCVEPVQPICIHQPKPQGRLLPVDLDVEIVESSGGEAGNLDRTDTAALQAHLDPGRVVHGNRLLVFGPLVGGPLVDVRVHHSANRGEFPEQVAREIDDVGTQVDERSASGELFAHAPAHWSIGILITRVEVLRAKRVDLTQEAFVDELLGAHQGRDETKIEGHAHMNTVFFGCGGDLSGLLGVDGQRLLTIDMLARGEGLKKHLPVEKVWQAAIHHIHAVLLQELGCIGESAPEPPVFCCPLGCPRIAGADALQNGLGQLARVQQGQLPVAQRVDFPDASVS
ncbi:Purine nucleoside phosphorylase DeoD-type [subsurface metagenome]